MQAASTELCSRLPEAVSERIHELRAAALPPEGRFVLYWMRVAARGHENPALDAALHAGRELGLPVFVYHALSERYPFASDRHHRFVLEGARDVASELRDRGIGYAFHLERPGQRGPYLRVLAEAAALVVTDEMPVPPLKDWTGAFRRSLAVMNGAPLWSVDASCIVPMPLVRKRYDRAFAFRNATKKLRAARLTRPWEEAPNPKRPFVPELPFEPVPIADLDDNAIAALIAECRIDHTVAPVPESPGGSRAGYERWRRFSDELLHRYDRIRNDAARDGTSRMSPYLHYGHVSPFRVAREAATERSRGAEKFADELLVWRELAWHWSFHSDDVEAFEVLPGWARETLTRHAEDPRPATYTWEELARGRTGDLLWDEAQHALRVHGELHNNLRMTWGKALLSWTRGPREAMAALRDLNHRYALDGRDPSSYGGLWWCLGLFDRPFTPEREVLGVVRPRNTRDHARRLDPARYAQRSRRPLSPAMPRVAVLGSGISGLACARALQDHGIEVEVFDASREPGGRSAPKRLAGLSWDAGAQYFTVRDPRLERYLSSWRRRGIVAPFELLTSRIAVREGKLELEAPAAPEGRWIGAPDMGALARHLGEELNLSSGRRVTSLHREGERWRIALDGEVASERFDHVLMALPPVDAEPLLRAAGVPIQPPRSAQLLPCMAVLFQPDAPTELPFEAARISGAAVSWVAREDRKPGRRGPERWVLHASPEWSAGPDARNPESLLGAFAELCRQLPTPIEISGECVDAEYWRHALALPADTPPAYFDEDSGVGLCGDWCIGARIEAAWLSGTALAGRVLGGLQREEVRQGELALAG